jgi:hypothetical protein
MLVHHLDPRFDVEAVIDRIFAARDRQKSLRIIDDHAKVWQRVIGTRGYTGNRAVSARPTFAMHFDFDEPETDPEDLDPTKLEDLEDSVDV